MAAERRLRWRMSSLLPRKICCKPISPQAYRARAGRLIVLRTHRLQPRSVTMNLTVRLGAHVDRTACGQLVAAETGFTLFGLLIPYERRTLVSFVGNAYRIPLRPLCGDGPDLVVEVLSPDDRPGETLAKVGDWLEAAARLDG